MQKYMTSRHYNLTLSSFHIFSNEEVISDYLPELPCRTNFNCRNAFRLAIIYREILFIYTYINMKYNAYVICIHMYIP